MDDYFAVDFGQVHKLIALNGSPVVTGNNRNDFPTSFKVESLLTGWVTWTTVADSSILPGTKPKTDCCK